MNSWALLTEARVWFMSSRRRVIITGIAITGTSTSGLVHVDELGKIANRQSRSNRHGI
jgi:hypothetical protein